MDWWRAYHGLPHDPKLALVALVTPCNARRGEVLEVWVALLDYASQNTPRGSIEGIDLEQIAWSLQMEIERVNAIMESLRKKRMISGKLLSAWDKRQPKRERDDDSRERVRAYRERQKRLELDDVTPGNAQIRVEESRLEKKLLSPPTPSCEFDLTPKEPDAETSADEPSVVRPALSATDALIEETAQRIHDRHPAGPDGDKRCGPAEIRRHLKAIVNKEHLAAVMCGPRLEGIEKRHALWCVSEAWTKEECRYARGLANWLALTMRRYDEEPPSNNGNAPRKPIEVGSAAWNRLTPTDQARIVWEKQHGTGTEIRG